MRLLILFLTIIFQNTVAMANELDALSTALPKELQQNTYRLWRGDAPLAKGETPEDIPTLTVYRPRENFINGSAVVIAPGGGYLMLASDLEGIEIASFFTARGITAFVLTYRVNQAARLPASLADGARAIRFVRHYAEHFGIDKKRIGMMGFSAGGHLTASTSVSMPNGLSLSNDSIDRENSRPDFSILGYPWLEATDIDDSGKSPYCHFANENNIACNSEDYTQFKPLNFVNQNTPKTFIYHTTTDKLVPVNGAVEYYQALVKHGVSAEMHLFDHGEHGTGLGGMDPALVSYGDLLDRWLRVHKIIPAI